MSLYKRNKTWWTDFRGVVQALPVGNLFSKLKKSIKALQSTEQGD